MGKCQPIIHKDMCKCGNMIELRIEGALRGHGNISLTCFSCKKINSIVLL